MNNIIILIALIIVIVLVIILSREHYTNDSLNNVIDMINNDSITVKKLETTDNINSQGTLTVDNIISKNGMNINGEVNINKESDTSTKINNTGIRCYNTDKQDNYLNKNGLSLNKGNLNIYNGGFIYQNHITYLYDNDAEVYIAKDLNYGVDGNCKFKCTAYGFYNNKNNMATVSTSWFHCFFNQSKSRWVDFFKIVINGITFYPIVSKYQTTYNVKDVDCGQQSGGGNINASLINPLSPMIAGSIEVMDFDGGTYRCSTDTTNHWEFRLMPITHNITYEKTKYPVYTVKNDDGGISGWTVDDCIIKIKDIDVSTTLETYPNI